MSVSAVSPLPQPLRWQLVSRRRHAPARAVCHQPPWAWPRPGDRLRSVGPSDPQTVPRSGGCGRSRAFADTQAGHRCSGGGRTGARCGSGNGHAAARAVPRQGAGRFRLLRMDPDPGRWSGLHSLIRAVRAEFQIGFVYGAAKVPARHNPAAGAAPGPMAIFRLPWGEHRGRVPTDSPDRQALSQGPGYRTQGRRGIGPHQHPAYSSRLAGSFLNRK